MAQNPYKHPRYAKAMETDGAIDIEHYAPIVKKLANILVARLPASVDVNDLIQVGIIGLIEAARQFDASHGVQFETYASQRIRGAMLDELRRMDWMPRQMRRHGRRIEEAIDQLEQQLGRAPLESEIAQHMALSLAEYQSLLSESRGLSLLYFDDLSRDSHREASAPVDQIADTSAKEAFSLLKDQQFHQHLTQAIKALPERDQLVMALYYEQELNLKEIGAVLGVSESRVCQLHAQAISRLRVKIKEWL